MNKPTIDTKEKPYLAIRYTIKYHKCNLKCPYCNAEWKKKNYTFDIDKFRKIINKILQLPYQVCLRIGNGGEMFTSPEMLETVSKICNEDNNITGVSFSSNVHADWDTVIKPFLDSTNTSKLGMGCTLHDTVIKDVDLFFDKIRMLKESGVLLYVGYVAFPDRIDYIKKYKKICDEIGVPLIMNAYNGFIESDRQDEKIHPQADGNQEKRKAKFYPKDYTKKEKDELRKLWFTPHSFKLVIETSSSNGMECSAGKNFINIRDNGDVFPCSRIDKSMGNILADSVEFQEKDTICPATVCYCGNEHVAMRIVDKYYDRTRTLRIFTPKKGIKRSELFKGYNLSIYSFRMRLIYKLKKIFSVFLNKK